jgi:hypothetical protein
MGRARRLIVAYYRDRGAPEVDVPGLIESIGFELGGIASEADPPAVWVDVGRGNHSP